MPPAINTPHSLLLRKSSRCRKGLVLCALSPGNGLMAYRSPVVRDKSQGLSLTFSACVLPEFGPFFFLLPLGIGEHP